MVLYKSQLLLQFYIYKYLFLSLLCGCLFRGRGGGAGNLEHVTTRDDPKSPTKEITRGGKLLLAKMSALWRARTANHSTESRGLSFWLLINFLLIWSPSPVLLDRTWLGGGGGGLLWNCINVPGWWFVSRCLSYWDDSLWQEMSITRHFSTRTSLPGHLYQDVSIRK